MTRSRFPAAPVCAVASAAARSRCGCWRMMSAAAPSPIAKIAAKTTANAGVKCDAAGARRTRVQAAHVSHRGRRRPPVIGARRERGGRRHRRAATDAELRAGHHRRTAFRTKSHRRCCAWLLCAASRGPRLRAVRRARAPGPRRGPRTRRTGHPKKKSQPRPPAQPRVPAMARTARAGLAHGPSAVFPAGRIMRRCTQNSRWSRVKALVQGALRIESVRRFA